MIYSIENDNLKVSIRKKGAELISIIRKDLNIEYVWQAKEYSWKKHAPNLFPFIGNIKDSKINYKIKNKNETYFMVKHGFAKDMDFNCLNIDNTKCSMILTSCDKTKEFYPYDFEFIISYIIEGNKLIIKHSVNNLGDESMFYHLGSHIAFSCKMVDVDDFFDYYLEFSDENISYYNMNIEKGLVTRKQSVLKLDSNRFNMEKDIFKEKDSLILNSLKSKFVFLKCKNHEHGLKYKFQEAPITTLWTPPDRGEFICIEPWFGITDFEDSNLNVYDKEYINILDSKESKDFYSEIEFF